MLHGSELSFLDKEHDYFPALFVPWEVYADGCPCNAGSCGLSAGSTGCCRPAAHTNMANSICLTYRALQCRLHRLVAITYCQVCQLSCWQQCLYLLQVYKPINPKAVTRNELYGYLHPTTREWKEGLVSVTFRDMANNSTNKHQWIVLDGDIDAGKTVLLILTAFSAVVSCADMIKPAYQTPHTIQKAASASSACITSRE